MALEDSCTFIVAQPASYEVATVDEVKQLLADPDVFAKTDGLRRALMAMLAGVDMSGILMDVIRGCVTVEDHALKKMLMLYWEAVRKRGADGKLLQELILVCNSLREDLKHPNEYVRGCTLRFLCKIRESDLVHELIEPVRDNLRHGHPYVRRHAVLTVHSIVRNFGAAAFPDAAEDIAKFIREEKDPAARRNAFIMLFDCDQAKALEFYVEHASEVEAYGEGFQLALLELARRTCRKDPAMKARFIGPIFQLLESESAAVAFEAASALVAMSSAPTAVRAATQAWTRLLKRGTDNNVRLVVIERLGQLLPRHARVLREQVMEVLRALGTEHLGVRKAALSLAMRLVSQRNVDEVAGLLRKEAMGAAEAVAEAKAVEETSDAAAGAGSSSRKRRGGSDALRNAQAYHRALVQALHQCAVRFPGVATHVLPALLSFVSSPDVDAESALDVAHLVRQLAETQPHMRADLLARLENTVADVQHTEVMRVALWVMGQFAESKEAIQGALASIRDTLGSLPLTEPHRDERAAPVVAPAAEGGEEEDGAAGPAEGGESSTAPVASKGPKILADGSYATQSAMTEASAAQQAAADTARTSSGPALRRLLLKGRGNWYLASALASTLTKLALRAGQAHGPASAEAKSAVVDALLVMTAVLEVGQQQHQGDKAAAVAGLAADVGATGVSSDGGSSGAAASSARTLRMDQDAFEHVVACIRILGEPETREALTPVLLDGCEAAFKELLSFQRISKAKAQILKERAQKNHQRGMGGSGSSTAASGGEAGMAGLIADAAALEELAARHAESEASEQQGGEQGPSGANARLPGYSQRPSAVVESKENQEDEQGPASGAGASNGRATTRLGGRSVGGRTSLQVVTQPDDVIVVRQLRGKGAAAAGGPSQMELALDDDAEVQRATASSQDDFGARLSRVHQLTGFSDAVYVEACVTVHDYDIVLDMALLNRSDRTLTNVSVELGTVGELKLVERPPVVTLGPGESRAVRASVKISSTESGYIYGTVVYDKPRSFFDKHVVHLSEVRIDIMDYIHPAYCEAIAFRGMWAEFEWENKVSVNTNLRSLQEYLAHIVKITSMQCLTPMDALQGDSEFLAANLYAKSTFGEDALANLSVMKMEDGSVRGHIRIRAKTQGVALALGDRITSQQKK